MNSVAVPFHVGPELDRAINRTDFFRVLKAAAHHYRFETFALARLTETSPPFGTRDIVLTGVAERRTGLFIHAMSRVLDLPQTRLTPLLATPLSGKGSLPEGYPPDLVLNEFDGNAFLLIPLFTPEGKRYCVVFAGARDEPDQGEIAEILLDAMRIFGKFYEEILSLETPGRLTQRETEVLKWTSEGKTSSEIAIILGLSEHTVNSHIGAAAKKLDAVNRVHMVAIALRTGLVS